MEGRRLRGTGEGKKPNPNAAITAGCTGIWAHEGASSETELPTAWARQEMERALQAGGSWAQSGNHGRELFS